MKGIEALECLLTDIDERIGKLQAARGHIASIGWLLEGAAAAIEPPVRRGRGPGRKKRGRPARQAKTPRGKKRRAKPGRKGKVGRPRQVKAAAPEPEAASAKRPDPAALGKSEGQVWRLLATSISESGLSPSATAIADALDMTTATAANILRKLAGWGFIRIEGERKAAISHVRIWPAGVKPRATIARTGQVIETPAAEAPPVRSGPARRAPRPGEIRIKPAAKPAPAEPARAARPFGDVV